MKLHLTILDPNNPDQCFPSINEALDNPDGLLAVGGCLSTNRLLNAYRHGIFPWNSPEEPILWWSPNPRLILFPENLVISHSLAKTLRKGKFTVTTDQAFDQIVKACANPRKDGLGTWISEEIFQAYTALHRLGYAHSVETWVDGNLVGGIYGIAIGKIFFGESMFYQEKDASKVAFVNLVQQLKRWGYKAIDCQVSTVHLKSLGAEAIPRDDFEQLLNKYCEESPDSGAW